MPLSDISFAGLSAALGALVMLLVAVLAVVVECMLALRGRPPRWRTRLAGPGLFALLAVIILALANSGPAQMKQQIDHWFVPVVVLAVLIWIAVRSWPARPPRRRQ